MSHHVTEIGRNAVWSLSTAKHGSGVQQLRDGNLDTFWQSDGPQPHYVNIQFHRVMPIKEISVYLDYKKDESYTPQRMVVRIGSSFSDLVDIKTVEWDEPTGWNSITFSNKDEEESGKKDDKDHKIIKTNMIQLVIEANHQNGRDTHVRQIKIYGPSNNSSVETEFSTIEFSMFACLR